MRFRLPFYLSRTEKKLLLVVFLMVLAARVIYAMGSPGALF